MAGGLDPRLTEGWLPSLPQGWVAERLAGRAWIRARLGWRGLTADEYVDDGVPMLSTPDIKGGRLSFEGVNRISRDRYEESPEIKLRVGDVLLTKDGATIGIVNVVTSLPEPTTVNGSIAVITPNSTVEPRYLRYCLASRYAQQVMTLLQGGMGVPHLFQADIKRIVLPFPALSEQERIADYLDRETARIDALIEKQLDMLAALKARIESARDARLGGVVGSGDRLKQHFHEVDRRVGEAGTRLPLMSVSIDWGVRRRDEVRDDLPRANDLSNYKTCRPGDLVINRMRAFQGALGIAGEEGIVSPDYAVLRTATTLRPDWLAETMKTACFVGEMTSRLRGIGSTEGGSVRTPRVAVSDIGQIRVSVPSEAQQTREVSVLMEERRQVSGVVATVQKHMDLARERRAALIAAAVTGQLDVSAGKVA